MRHYRKLYLGALLIALCLHLAPAGAALAHAVVVRSDPPDNATLERTPETLRLWFSEPIARGFTQARVLDGAGEVVPGTQSFPDATDNTLLTVRLPALPDGVYTVVYTALSAADGHATEGHIVFRVGQAGAAAAAPLPPGPPVPWSEALLRALDFAGQAGLIGALAVAALLLGAGRPGDTGAILVQARRRVLRWGALCGLLAMACGSMLLVRQAAILAAAAAGDGGAAPLGQMLWRLVAGTRGGQLWVGRQVLLIVLAANLWGLARLDRLLWPLVDLLALLGGALLATTALTGHAVALSPTPGLAVAVDWAHLAAASLWVGSLAGLAVGLLPLLWPRRGTPAFDALALAGWRPFGALAALCVAVLFASGLYSTGREVASVDALVGTFYGRTLSLKVGLVLLTGLAGLLSALLLHPGLAAPLARALHRPSGWTPMRMTRLPVLVLAEVALGLAVLLATGAITTVTPPHGPQFAPVAPPAPIEPLSGQAGDLLVTFEAQPNQPGANVLTMRVASSRRPAAEVLRVILHLTFLGQTVGTVSADAQPTGADTYRLAGSQFGLPGPWQVDVVVRRKGLEDSTARFNWTVDPAITPHRVFLSDRPLEPVLTVVAAGLFLLLVVVGPAAWLWRKSGRGSAAGRVGNASNDC